MIPAAVGFQCPECVKQGRVQTRTVFGGRVAANPHAATYTLIGLNCLAYPGRISRQARSSTVSNRSVKRSTSRTVRRTLVGVAHGEYYRLLTSMFIHEPPSQGGAFFLHILFNMWALFVVGPPLEALLGRVRFVAMYLLTGLAGSVLVYVLVDPRVPGYGASGAIFGLFGALFVLGRRLRLNIQPIALTIGLNLVLSFSLPGISWQAHIGGLIAGAGLGAAWATRLDRSGRRFRSAARRARCVARHRRHPENAQPQRLTLRVTRTQRLTLRVIRTQRVSVIPSVDNSCG